MELLDFVAAKFHEEGGVFKLLVSERMNTKNMFSHIHHVCGFTSPLYFSVKLLEGENEHFLVVFCETTGINSKSRVPVQLSQPFSLPVCSSLLSDHRLHHGSVQSRLLWSRRAG